MNERLRKLRKSLGLTLEKFGEPLGVQKTAISNLENGNRNLTDQMIKAICNTYSVNEEWLRTGEGNMMKIIPDENLYMRAAMELSDDDFARWLLLTYYKQTEPKKKALLEFLRDLSATIQEGQDK